MHACIIWYVLLTWLVSRCFCTHCVLYSTLCVQDLPVTTNKSKPNNSTVQREQSLVSPSVAECPLKNVRIAEYHNQHRAYCRLQPKNQCWPDSMPCDGPLQGNQIVKQIADSALDKQSNFRTVCNSMNPTHMFAHTHIGYAYRTKYFASPFSRSSPRPPHFHITSRPSIAGSLPNSQLLKIPFLNHDFQTQFSLGFISFRKTNEDINYPPTSTPPPLSFPPRSPPHPSHLQLATAATSYD